MINYELAKEIGATHYADNGDLYKVSGSALLCYGLNEEWKESVAAPWFIVKNIKPIHPVDQHTKQSTAVETLERMGYEWHGGELWKPQLGKPKFEYEHTKVNPNHDGGAFWECAKDYAEGVVFTTMGTSEQLVIDSVDDLLERYKCNNLYRRTEKRVDWLREVMDKFSIQRNDRGLISMTYNDVGFAEPVFLEMCRAALRARGEL